MNRSEVFKREAAQYVAGFSGLLTEERLQRLLDICVMLFEGKHEGEHLTEEEKAGALAHLMTQMDISMELGSIVELSEPAALWYSTNETRVNYYWNRYEHALQGSLPCEVVKTLDTVTTNILDRLGNPSVATPWARRGLVVGHVQSGKTANYIGVMCKAADAGYKVIIVLSGTLNELRSQTQERIDANFIGQSTKTKRAIGVAKDEHDPRVPICFTTVDSDFDKTIAEQACLSLGSLAEPVVLVLKKNVKTLNAVRSWFKNGNSKGLANYPMLLIDDEADYASINTTKSENNPTAINKGIRELLKLFPRNTYLGYTATPFANIFIDPDDETMMSDGEKIGDLFPRDFIYRLDPPSNYFGPTSIFTGEEDNPYLRDISDADTYLPLNHKKYFKPKELPPSLKEAMRCFLLVKTIRELDGQMGKHHSMMINASRFTNVHARLKRLVAGLLGEWKQEIKNWANLLPEEALAESPLLRELKALWEIEFKDFDQGLSKRTFSWEEVQRQLAISVPPIDVVSINNNSEDRLDYSAYPEGRALIAIGGLGLSRGLTLEGLSVSYFLRNSMMYDTLLQMGRWFGYRPYYVDLCRVYMPRLSSSWYTFITSALEEFREDLREMEKAKLTPLQFGLKVRAHPAALIVTARNKMRSSKEFVCQIALDGRFVESYRLINNAESLRRNCEVLERAAQTAQLSAAPEKVRAGWLWRKVPLDILRQVVTDFACAPGSIYTTTPKPILDHLKQLKESRGVTTCDVVLRGKDDGVSFTCAGLKIGLLTRAIEEEKLVEGGNITFNNRHILSGYDEAIGLSEAELKAVAAEHPGETIVGKDYRRYKGEHGYPPQLSLFFVQVAPARVEYLPDGRRKRVKTGECITVPAYTVSFPGSITDAKNQTVSYVMNRTAIEQVFNVDTELEDMEEEEEDAE